MLTHETNRPWRAAAAGDADRAATTQDQFVDATRRNSVRYSIAVIRGAQTSGIPRDERRLMVARVLADSVSTQARVSGLGRIEITVRGSA